MLSLKDKEITEKSRQLEELMVQVIYPYRTLGTQNNSVGSTGWIQHKNTIITWKFASQRTHPKRYRYL